MSSPQPPEGWPAPPGAWLPPAPGGTSTAPYSTAPYAPPPQTGSGSGLAVAALVLSVLSLLGVLLLGAWVLVAGGPMLGGPMVGDLSGETLTGRLPSAPAGALPGPVLAEAVTDRVEEDGGDVTAMTCPATPRVGQGVVTVCHGSISGETWAVVVYFEDEHGTFTLNPL